MTRRIQSTRTHLRRNPPGASLALCAVVLAAACTGSAAPAPTVAPDIGKRVVAERGVVASGNAYASDAGLEILRRGGNAMDAAVATALVLGVTEPMMSGLGGGGGLLHWDAKNRRADYLDFYSASGAVPDTTVHALGTSATPRGVGIPGAVRGLLAAHERFGRLPRAAVFEAAIRLAAEGFTVNSILSREIASTAARLRTSPGASRLFLPDDRPLRAGDRLVQAELARTLERIAAEGADVFYAGEIGDRIVETLRAGGSTITRADFAAFQPRWTRPVCTTYRGRVILSATAPQSGMQVVEALNLLAGRDLPRIGLPSRSPEAFRTMAGAMRVAIADRDAIIGDPAKVGIPMAGVTSAEFAASRASKVDEPVTGALQPGDPWPYERAPRGECATVEAVAPATLRPASIQGDADERSLGETTHLSVVDPEGNAVSLTNTLGVAFGTGTWAEGVLLNSAILNFSRRPGSPNTMGAHRVPVSTIAPTLVLRAGGEGVEIVVGGPGSLAIPPGIVQTMVYLLDYKLDPLEALRMPRMLPLSSRELRMESGFADAVYAEARRLGYEVVAAPAVSMSFGGVHVIQRVGSRWVGAADPRRDGEVRGW